MKKSIKWIFFDTFKNYFEKNLFATNSSEFLNMINFLRNNIEKLTEGTI